MVLAKKVIPGTSQNDGVLGSFNKDSVLAGARQVTLNGALGQILQLAAYSNELFSGLMKETNNIHGRIVNIGRRLQNVSSRLPQLDDFFKNTNYEALHIQVKAEYHVPSLEKSRLLDPITQPPSLVEVYQKTIPPPTLDLLDPYNDPPGASCLKQYSNPHFFIDEWMAEMERQRALALEKRKERKKEREAARAKAGLTKKAAADGRVEAKPVARQRFDPHTGQKIIEQQMISPRPESPMRVDPSLQSTSSPNLLRAQPAVPQTQTQKPAPALRSSSSTSITAPAQNNVLNGQPAFQQAAPSYATMRSGVLKQHGRAGSAPSPGEFESATPAPSAQIYAPPPVMAPPSSTPAYYANNQGYANNQAYANQAYATPTYAAPTYSTPPPMAPAAPAPNAPKPPPLNIPKPPPSAPAPPPPPTPTSSSTGGGGLLAALAEKGQSLRPTEEKKPAQSDLLTQIRSGISLKTAQSQIEENKKEQVPGIAIADSDDEEEEEEDEDWD